MHPPAIEVNDLSAGFANQTIFDGLSLKVQPGEKIAITGPSGCGKSTLLQCILGFLEPLGGSISISGNRLSNESVWKLRQSLAYVSQEPDLGDGSVREFLEQPFTYRANRSMKSNLSKAPEFLERLGFDDCMDRSVGTLSGGEKQRIALIAALLLDRPILLLDEPSSALDESSRDRVMELLASKHNLTILSVSHDREWTQMADRTFSMQPATGATI
ncbi:MAG: ABC transporter ATP-binding protein [Leptospiraceae bacterium]|nr:ABC transporter ATP-binding protein [Leptospiraceae bacterium]